MKIRHRIMLCLMDGTPHRLGDFLGYITKNIDPKMAVRKYLQSYTSKTDKNKDLSLDCQIKFGSKLMIKEAMRSMVEEGIIEPLQEDSVVWKTEDSRFQITDSGKEWLGKIEQGMNPLNSIFIELGCLYRKGQLEIAFSIKNSAGAFQ